MDSTAQGRHFSTVSRTQFVSQHSFIQWRCQLSGVTTQWSLNTWRWLLINSVVLARTTGREYIVTSLNNSMKSSFECVWWKNMEFIMKVAEMFQLLCTWLEIVFPIYLIIYMPLSLVHVTKHIYPGTEQNSLAISVFSQGLLQHFCYYFPLGMEFVMELGRFGLN